MCPLYEFECKECGSTFEAFRHMDDRHHARCKCGQSAGQVMSVVNHSVGWRLTERSHERFGPRDEIERDV